MERNNQLEYFFVLGRENTQMDGCRLPVVNSGSSGSAVSAYTAFYAETNIGANPEGFYWGFVNTIYFGAAKHDLDEHELYL